MDVIHILAMSGKTFCGMSRYEKGWPEDHQWIDIENYNKEVATCAKCREAFGLQVTSKH